MQQYDVVIAGGGMVGASLACALAEASSGAISLLVVEGFPLPEDTSKPSYQPSFDARSTALSAGSKAIIEAMGVWQHLSEHLQRINQIHVSNKGRLGSTLMNAEQENLPALGYVVENQWLGKVLLAAVQSHACIDWRSPAKVSAVDTAGEKPLATIRQNDIDEKIGCSLLVIADGAPSALAQSIGIQYSENDYRHSAIIANIATAKPHLGLAYERFTDTGPLAMLPLAASQGHNRSALVWTMPCELAEEIINLPDEDFLLRLQERFGYRLGKLQRVGERASYPLKLIEACEQVRRGVVVMGNAAHFLHPVAGQGFNLALRDINGLCDLVCNAKGAGDDLGSLRLLEQYRENQAWDQRKTTVFSDKVGEVFMADQMVFAALRDFGLSALDVVPSLKSKFVKETAGLVGARIKW
ncbi:MAG: 2-octaprenyl-6-methoxyphenol hydroxylase [Pseudomonadales bacterium]|jgi:2-octaprenyl-6-methoxyphenol hydroxylase